MRTALHTAVAIESRHSTIPLLHYSSIPSLQYSIIPSLLLLLILWTQAALWAGTILIPAATLEGPKAHLGDPKTKLLVVSGKGGKATLDLSLGRVRVAAFFRYNGKGSAYRQTVFSLSAGGRSSGATVDAIGTGAPIVLTFINRQTDAATITVSGGSPTPEGRKELLAIEAKTVQAEGPDKVVVVEDEAEEDLELDGDELEKEMQEQQAVDARASPMPMVLLERLEVTPLSGSVLVTSVTSDRVTYKPGMKGTLTVALENLEQTAATAKLSVQMAEGLESRTPVFSDDIQLPAAGNVETRCPFEVGTAQWGRGFEVTVKSGKGQDLGTHTASVITNLWQVGVNNYYEAFAWAPCDFSELTPDNDEPFYSGQTQYFNTRPNLIAKHKALHQEGRHAITYGKSCCSGLPGVQYALRHPEQMNVFGPAGFAHEVISVEILDRMLENRYRKHGLHEDYWQMWISCWTAIGNIDAVNYGCDEIARSAKLLGWDGVRYDGHFTVWRDRAATARMIKYAEDRISEQVPGFAFGYNCMGGRHNSARGAFSDVELAAICHGGGMAMSEVYRYMTHSIKANIEHLRWGGDMVRLHGGYPLAICDDSNTWNLALVLAAGWRPLTSGGALLKRFATRFSAFVLDPAMRRLQDPRKVISPVGDPSFLWDSFIYEKELGEGRSALILQLVNVSEKFRFGGTYRPPTGLNPPQRNVQFDLNLPEGYAAGSVFASEDYESFRPMDATLKGDRLTVPHIGLWAMVVVKLKKEAGARSLYEQCEIPLKFEEAESPEVRAELVRMKPGHPPGPKALELIQQGKIKITPELLAAVFAMGPPPESKPGDGLYRPVGFSEHQGGKDEQWYEGTKAAIELRRNGRPDLHYARGVFYHLNRMYEAFAQLPGVEITTSSLNAGRRACGSRISAKNVCCLAGYPSRERLAEVDILVLDNIPAAGLSLRQRRDILEFVEGGGSLLVLGGWYALSRGCYEGSFIEDILPVRCKQHVYLRRFRPEHGMIESTPDYQKVLGAPAPEFGKGFAVEWASHVEPREGANVLMSAAGHPLLVTGTFGKGRVAVWAGSHSGEPEAPYWQSHAWPQAMSHVLSFLARRASEVSAEVGPDPQVIKKISQLKESMESNALFGDVDEDEVEEKEKKACVSNLRTILSAGRKADARFVAAFLLENPGRVNPGDYPPLVEAVLPHIRSGKDWAELGREFVKKPPLMMERLVAEIAAVAIPDIEFDQIMSWKNIGEITRLRCLAAAGDKAALPHLQKVNDRLDAREAKWAEYLANETNPHLTLDIYQTRLVRPFVTYAMLRCGKRDEKTLYQFCRGCLDPPYYLWRQHWILQSLYSFQDTGDPRAAADNRVRIKQSHRAIQQLHWAIRQMSPLFTPQVIGMDDIGCRAAARAIRECDCHKSLSLCLRFLNELKAEDVKGFGLLENAKLDSTRYFYRSVAAR